MSPRAEARSKPANTSPYTTDGAEHSYFRDMAVVALSEARKDAAIENPRLRGRDPGEMIGEMFPGPGPRYADETADDARGRLTAHKRSVERTSTHESWLAGGLYRQLAQTERNIDSKIMLAELRDLSSAAGSGAGFIPSGAPTTVQEAFRTAARAQATVAAALGVAPLPAKGLEVQAPRLSTTATAEIHTEHAAITESSPTTALATSPVGYIVAMVDVSQQLLDRNDPVTLDQAIGADLGAALAVKFDDAILHGSGTAPQPRGIYTVANTGGTTITYTDATPTAAELAVKLWQSYSVAADGATGGGTADPGQYVTVVHPRRLGFFMAASGAGFNLQAPGRLVPSSTVPVNLGAGTNEDRALVIDTTQVVVLAEPPTFRAHVEPLDGILAVRLIAHQPVALLGGMTPKSLVIIAGTGMVAPTWATS